MKYVYVKFKNNEEAFYTDVTDVTNRNTLNSTDELRITVLWTGDENTVHEYLPLAEIDYYEVYDQDDPDGEARYIEFIKNN